MQALRRSLGGPLQRRRARRRATLFLSLAGGVAGLTLGALGSVAETLGQIGGFGPGPAPVGSLLFVALMAFVVGACLD